MTTKEPQKDSKRIGEYEIKFKVDFGGLEDDSALIISLNRPLADLLRSVIVPNEVKEFMLHDIIHKRYAVKRIIFNDLEGEARDVLFMKDLIDNGTVSLKTPSVRSIERAMEGLRGNVAEVVRLIRKYSNFEVKTTYSVLEPHTEKSTT